MLGDNNSNERFHIQHRKQPPKQTLTKFFPSFLFFSFRYLVRSHLGLDSARFTHSICPGLLHRTEPRLRPNRPTYSTLTAKYLETRIRGWIDRDSRVFVPMSIPVWRIYGVRRVCSMEYFVQNAVFAAAAVRSC